MTKRVILYLLFFAILPGGGVFAGPVVSGPEPETVILMANEEYVGEIAHKQTRYLKVTLTNLAEAASTARIAFYRERIELSADRVGPVEFRTFTLEKENDTQTRIWTTLNFDEFTLNVETGHIQVTVEKPMDIR